MIRFAEDKILQYKIVHSGAHKASISIFRRAYNRLAADVKGRIHQHRAPGYPVKFALQSVKPRVGVFVHSLNTRGLIHMRDSRDLGARYVQLFDAKKRLLRSRHFDPPRLCHVGHNQHKRTLPVQLKPL